MPLQSWLLDAMEGPTPVSALIHAATMVTAGVYLITRSNAIYAQSPIAGTVVVVVGTVTLLFGAWIGCAKDDIKRVLAGSTMSQIGYMMLAAGIGPAGYAFAIFHLLTHGFFKADMFLGAGSVMHATNDEVDMRHYGALRTLMPITFVTFAAGYLAIIGFPFFSGFYSKDHIIEAAFQRSAVVGCLRMLGAGITGFYMTRLMLMTFVGKKRWKPDVHPHESPPVMTVPLIFLGIGSAIGGLVLNNWIVGWLDPAVGGGVRRGAARSVALLGHRPRHAGRRRHRCCDQRVDLRTTSRNPDHSASEPVVPSPWPAAMIFTAMPSTRPCSCDRGSSSPRAWCVSRIPGSTAR